MFSWKNILLLVICLVPAILIADETPVLQRTGKTFDPSIPTIQSVLGYDFGQNITRHAEMERYYQALVAAAPQQIKMEKIGETYEGRALYYVILSSAQNMSRLEDFRQNNLKLADPRKTPSSEADQIIQNDPVFVALTYSVHGNEHSGVEAGMAIAYYLLASKDEETQTILKNCVIIIDPMQNPDGRERFINYFYQTKGLHPSGDLNSAEHNEVWPRGRYNHYLFDMNRDWIALTQTETRARIHAYQQYQPQVYIDLHEMGENSTYFFPPTSTPQNPNVPKSTLDWWRILGKAVANDFDKNDIDYFTSEGFDFWFPGYGDSWPAYNGALSATFEEASVRGLLALREDGLLVHYQDAIWHHFVSSLAVCKMSSSHREDKLRDFYNFRTSAVQEGRTQIPKAYIINRQKDPLECDRLVERLLFQGIEVRQATSDFHLAATDYPSDIAKIRDFHAGDYIISMDQPLKRLIKVIFEKEEPFDKKFLEEEARRKSENEPTEIYDITAWAIPLAYNLDVYWSADPFTAGSTALTAVSSKPAALAEAGFAYVLDYDSNEAIAAALQLMGKGVRIYSSLKPFTLNGKDYRAGSFIVKVKDNPKELRDYISQTSVQTGASFDATNTAWTEEGPDLGSEDVFFLQKPKVAVLSNEPTDATSCGAIRYLFDFHYPADYTVVEAMQLGDLKLKDYNVIVFPDGSDYSDYIKADTLEQLKNWIRNGGTLIAIGGGTGLFADNSDFSDAHHIKKFLKNSTEEPEDSDDKKKDAKQDTEKPDFVPGSIARVNLYKKSFLTFGYGDDQLPVFVYSDNVLSMKKDAKPAVVYAGENDVKYAGLFWDITRKRLAGKVYSSEEKVGEGHVILFAEDPNFRAYWDGLNKLFMNGILYGPSL